MMVADTDVLIDYLADKGPMVARVARLIELGALHTTAVNRFELLSGTRSDRQRGLAETLLASLSTLPLDEVAADEAAAIRRDLEMRGQTIGMGDSLIAGIVRAHGGSLLTRNRSHFERVEGLSLASTSSAPDADRV